VADGVASPEGLGAGVEPGAGVAPREGSTRGAGGEAYRDGPKDSTRGGTDAPGLGAVPASSPAGAIDPLGAIVAGVPGVALVAGVSLDGRISSGAGVVPGVDPKATIAIAATTTHAVAAARPTRPARRRGRDLAPAAITTFCLAGGCAGGWTGGRAAVCGEMVSGCAAGRRAGCFHAGRRSTVGWPATSPSRRSRYGSAGAAAPGAGLESPPLLTGNAMAAGAATTWREAGGSTSRKGAHLRHAASTRFQQSAQHAAPQLGQSR
jgi:hypothetical protein